jgi:hypothetical protein
MLEIRNQDIFFEEDNSPEAIDKKIAQANIDHLNGLKAALDHNALNHRELENVKILVEAAPTAILKKVLKMLIKDDLQDQQRKMESL